MLKFVRGDLLKTPLDVIAHGCNCQQNMGAGIAKYISQFYPEVRRADRHFVPQKAKDRLGLIDVVPVHTVPQNGIKYVANCYTQLNIGRGVQISYRAIRDCMRSLNELALIHDLSLALPKIGAGLGGGNWETIREIMEEEFNQRTVTVYYL